MRAPEQERRALFAPYQCLYWYSRPSAAAACVLARQTIDRNDIRRRQGTGQERRSPCPTAELRRHFRPTLLHSRYRATFKP